MCLKHENELLAVVFPVYKNIELFKLTTMQFLE